MGVIEEFEVGVYFKCFVVFDMLFGGSVYYYVCYVEFGCRV